MKIAVDAMGGDRAPDAILRGVADAVDKGFLEPEEVILVGREPVLEPLCAGIPALARVPRAAASQVVAMGESATSSLRSKTDSSIQVGLRLVHDGAADVFLSAGNTGAVVASAWSVLGRLKGVRRPGIAITFQSRGGPVLMVDVGANVHCKPLHLFQYGVMADIVLRDVHGVTEPRIALLNIGEEEGKGTELVRETDALFRASNLNFVGNIEGNDVLSGRCNAIVCEGFVGNVVLKVTEGVGAFFLQALASAVEEVGGEGPLARALKVVSSKLDYAEYGGAPLLGVDGLVMIMHGRSDRRAVANALKASRQYVEGRVIEHIRSTLETSSGSSGSGVGRSGGAT